MQRFVRLALEQGPTALPRPEPESAKHGTGLVVVSEFGILIHIAQHQVTQAGKDMIEVGTAFLEGESALGKCPVGSGDAVRRLAKGDTGS